MKEKEIAEMAAEMARQINEAAEKKQGNALAILDIIVALVAPSFRLTQGRG